MYYRFQIEERALRDFIASVEQKDVCEWATPLYDDIKFLREKSNIIDIVSKWAIGENNNIDGGQIQSKCFKTNLAEDFHIFVSHSHGDIDLVENFAKTMKRVFGVNCFVDSMVWEKKEDILKELNKFNIIEDIPNTCTRYAHEPVIRTADHVHAMLSMALLEMIDRCEMCLFVHSNNSVFPEIKTDDFKEETLSSWIYEEISMMNRIRLVNPTRPIVESREFDANNRHTDAHKDIPITHPLDLTNFINLTGEILPQEGKGTKWLDNLYTNVINII